MYTFYSLVEAVTPLLLTTNDWANNSLTSKGYEQNVHTWLHAALALISKQAHLLSTPHAANTVQFKVNGTDPYVNGLIAYRPTAALIVYAAPVCIEYGQSSGCQCNRILLRCILPTTKSLA